MMTGETHPKAGDARDAEFMRQALRLARIALDRGDTPVGSVVVYDGRIVGEGIEAVRTEKDLTAHAELKAVREACRALDSLDLAGCTLFTTAEPCFMCSFVIRSAHVSRVVSGKAVPHIGGISSNHPILIDSGIPNWPRPPELVTGVLEEECRKLFMR
ncbi:MAG: nucleoside deaminase [Terriglobia bacterium]